MELVLNLVWVALATAMFWHGWRQTPARTSNRSMQLVALALIIIILLPAISVTDDLLAAQNPAEVDVCLRRSHDWLDAHILLPVTPAIAVTLFSFFTPEPQLFLTSAQLPLPAFGDPAAAPISNRPPPAL